MEEEEFEEGGAGGAEEKASAMEPWMAGVAKRLWRMCHSLRSELMHERLISLLVEWCETPRAESACVAYKDTCVEYFARLGRKGVAARPEIAGKQLLFVHPA